MTGTREMKKAVLFLLILFSFSLAVCAQGNGNTSELPDGETKVNIKITVNSVVELRAVMTDNAAARDFVSLLPLTVTLEDYNHTEKISSLPKKLSTMGAPSGYTPSVGDICFYAPWGNLSIFYRDFGYSNGLVLLGKIEGGMDVFNVTGSITVKIEAETE
jgi:hypothetical protein